MTQSVIQPLESLRLARYIAPVQCYICGGDNPFDREFCGQCGAPLALTSQTGDFETEPQLIAAVGPSASGKTVYLGMLVDMLSRQTAGVHLLARGAFSITLQQQTVSALSRSRFPDKTPNEPDRWNWVHCQMRLPGRKRPMELILPDMAGEAVLSEVHHPHSQRIIRAFLTRSKAAMLFIDATRLARGRMEEDHLSMKLLSYLGEVGPSGRPMRQDRPVALIFTKADQCEDCRLDADGFARRHAPGLWRLCQERLHHWRCFAAGVAGAVARIPRDDGTWVERPLRVEPHGVVEPFLWLVEKLVERRRRWWPWGN